MEYGKTGDARIEAVRRSEARQWALSRVTDSVGNYLTVSYREAEGYAYPQRIDYTGYKTSGAPYASVRFTYWARHDPIHLSVGGSTIQLNQRLARIKTYDGTTLVSDYRLTYSTAGLPQPARVTSIARCDGAANCLPATDFTWNDVGDGALGAAKNTSHRYTGYARLVGDFDGDGVSDVAWTSATTGKTYVALGNGDGTFGATKYFSAGFYNVDGYTARVGDFNGDGVSDLVWMGVYIHQGPATFCRLRSYVALGQGSGTFAAAKLDTLHSDIPSCSSGDVLVGDFNGDGKSDLAFTQSIEASFPPGNDGYQRAYIALGQGNGLFSDLKVSTPSSRGSFGGYRSLVGDFNGDGLSDIAFARGFAANSNGPKVHIALSNGDGTLAGAVGDPPSTMPIYSTTYDPVHVGDFNGDGLTGLGWTRASKWGLQARIALSDGDGTFAAARSSSPRSGDFRSYRAQVGEFNGDGLADVVWVGAQAYVGKQAYVALGNGDGGLGTARKSTWSSSGGSDMTYRVGEVNGDGVSDLVRVSGSGVSTFAAVVPSDHGRIASIHSATGPTFTLDYASLTEGGASTLRMWGMMPVLCRVLTCRWRCVR